MSEQYIPKLVLEWRERNKHLMENREKKTLGEILNELNEWHNKVQKVITKNENI